jgi:hypothetical protein
MHPRVLFGNHTREKKRTKVKKGESMKMKLHDDHKNILIFSCEKQKVRKRLVTRCPTPVTRAPISPPRALRFSCRYGVCAIVPDISRAEEPMLVIGMRIAVCVNTLCLSLSLSFSHTHTPSLTQTHILTYTRILTHFLTHTHTYTYTHTHTPTTSHIYTHTHTHTHTHTLSLSLTHTHIHSHAYILTRTHNFIHTQSHSYTTSFTQPQSHIQSNTRAPSLLCLEPRAQPPSPLRFTLLV